MRRVWWLALVAGMGWAAGRAWPESPALPPAVARGAALYQRDCAACHGVAGSGAPGAPALDGPRLARDYPSRQALARFIAENMPASAPGTLSPTMAEDLARYLRRLNPAQGAPSQL
ncbi:MAG: cytochrome c [Firmicutes bacterium]|nr:cytochrome c [Alicyclobacillaceae bacterium]MCL6497661.1 cytochrome c [Bacillota bacterium]